MHYTVVTFIKYKPLICEECWIPLVSDPEFRGCAQVKFQHEHKCTKEIQAVTGKKHALKKNDQFFF